jgi:L-alanine-DL-glutamate epimerase-like enolase superfamily enzyme
VKIENIETIPIAVGVDRRVGEVRDAKGFRFTSHLLVVTVRTDSGLEGLGEFNGTANWSGETHVGAKALIDQHFAPRLVGEDPRQIRACMAKMDKVFGNPFAKAAIEIALFDTLGKATGAPLYQLLGGPVRPLDLPVRFPIMPVGPAESADVATRMVAEGFQTIKLKVGHDPLPHDLARVRLVREAIGKDVRLTVDANGGWSVNEAIRAAHALEEYEVAFVEQPVHRLDLDGLARVRQQIRLPVMADEAVFTPQDALTCIQKGAADIISVYPGKNGGILNTLAIVSMAAAAGVTCAIGSNVEWDIASAAMAHLSAALPDIAVEQHATDIIGPYFHTQHACDPPWLAAEGRVCVPSGPGLGIALEPAAFAALLSS